MSKSVVYSICLFTSLTLTIIGALFKIQHWEGARLLFSVSLIMSIPFIFLGINDVFQNKKSESISKFMYALGFIFLSGITGLVYLQTFRKRNSN